MSANGESEVQYGDLIRRALRLRRRMALVVFVLVAGPLIVYALLQESLYESTGTVWVEESRVELFKNLGKQNSLDVILAIMSSRSLAASVVDALPRRAYDELLRNRLYTDWGIALANRVRSLRGQPVVAPRPRDEVISELLKARMTFASKGTTGIINVTAAASDPVIAADIATAYIETVQSKTRSFSREEYRAVREFLGSQAKQVGATLREAEDAMVQFEREKGLVRVDDRAAQFLQTLGQAEVDLSRVRLAEDIARTRLAAIKGQLEGRSSGKKVTGSLTVQPGLRDLFERWQKAETAVAALTRRFTDAHPEVQATRGEAHQAWARLEPPLREALSLSLSPSLSPLERAPLIEQALTLAQEVGRLTAEREAHEARAGGLRARLNSLSEEQHEFARRRQAVETTKSLYILVTTKAQEAGSRPEEDLRNVRVLDPPVVPITPSGGKRLKFTLVGLVLGLAAALGVPVGLEMLDSTIKTEEEAEVILGSPVLGSLLAMEPRTALANGGRARALLPSAPSAREG